MGDVLAVVEQRRGNIRGVSFEVVSVAAGIAQGMGGTAHAMVIGGGGVSSAASDLGRFGAGKVLAAESDALVEYHPQGFAYAVSAAVKAGGYDAVVFGATAQGKDLAPRVAALLDVPLASDITDVQVESGGIVAVRPVFAGKAFASVTFSASPALVSIRPNVFPAKENPAAGDVEAFDLAGLDPTAWTMQLKEFQPSGGGSKDVAEASVVVTGGRGMKGPENWGLLEGLRDALGEDAALGASRAVVDAGWRPHSEQVGQTGKTVAPKLYFALGISGAIQHLAGMRTSGTIVAVNKDPDAPIFQVADYGIVGDLFEVVPRIAEEVQKLKAGD
ncbi:MAG: electron transfer flavoprotein subunit alpha/FixB family protein [Gemmatimonadetes bacterium]|nr:electron transfer flavoprotein subunit alpha/FixB family protein [Gemmatimonadota bacterium]NNM05595.1 electron transfer flavoprotein subunit alpha/FixB family protein [Gemmatimonadota bacterium]